MQGSRITCQTPTRIRGAALYCGQVDAQAARPSAGGAPSGAGRASHLRTHYHKQIGLSHQKSCHASLLMRIDAWQQVPCQKPPDRRSDCSCKFRDMLTQTHPAAIV